MNARLIAAALLAIAAASPIAARADIIGTVGTGSIAVGLTNDLCKNEPGYVAITFPFDRSSGPIRNVAMRGCYVVTRDVDTKRMSASVHWHDGTPSGSEERFDAERALGPGKHWPKMDNPDWWIDQ